MALPNEPITRREMYLASIAGQNVEIPDAPITREEMYLDAIARSGGTGEGDMKKSAYDSDLSVAEAGGIKMFVNSSMSGLTTRMGIAEGKITTLQENKVDKETGKGLSTNDYSNAEKAKVGSIAPTEADSTSASTDYEVGEEFFLSDGNLYTATSPISQGSAIVVYPTSGYNCKLSDSVTGQIKALEDSLGTASTKNSTSVVTQSTDLVESGAVYDALVDGEVSDCKNLLPITLDNLKGWNTAGSWSDNVYSLNGVDFTVNTNDNGHVLSIKANGTNNASSQKGFRVGILTLPAGSYRANGLVNNGSYSTFWINSYNVTDSANIVDVLNANTDADFTLQSSKTVQMTFYFAGNSTLSDVYFYPMIRKATESDPTYEPYYIPLKDVVPNKCDNSVIGTVEDGATASQAYAVGSHAIRNGAFITWKNAKAQGETINDASDYTSGDVADDLTVNDVTSEFTLLSTNLTFNSTYSKIHKQGRLITVNLRFTASNTLSGNVPIYTKPTKYQPKVSHYVPLYNSANHECVGLMIVDNIGTNAYIAGADIAQGTEIVCSDTYFI